MDLKECNQLKSWGEGPHIERVVVIVIGVMGSEDSRHQSINCRMSGWPCETVTPDVSDGWVPPCSGAVQCSAVRQTKVRACVRVCGVCVPLTPTWIHP